MQDVDGHLQDDVTTLYLMFRRNGRKLRGDFHASNPTRVHNCALFDKLQLNHYELIQSEQDPHAPSGSIGVHGNMPDSDAEWPRWNAPAQNANADHAPPLSGFNPVSGHRIRHGAQHGDT